MSSAKEQIKSAIDGHDVAVFSKSYCPYCRKAKDIIKQLGLPEESVYIIELDETEDGSQIQDELEKQTGQRTVPNIFIKQKHIGGCSDLTKFSADGLKRKVGGLE